MLLNVILEFGIIVLSRNHDLGRPTAALCEFCAVLIFLRRFAKIC